MMRHLIIAVLYLATVFAVPSRHHNNLHHEPYSVNPGVGAIYKNKNDETIVAGPDGSKITKESDSVGAIQLNEAPRAGAIEAVAITPEIAGNLANTGPNLFTNGGEEIFVRRGEQLVNGLVQTAGHIGHDLIQDVVDHSRPILIEGGDGLAPVAHSFIDAAANGLAEEARRGLVHATQTLANNEAVLRANGNGFVNPPLVHDTSRSFGGPAHDGTGNSGRAFAGLAHDGRSFDGLAHDERAFAGLAHDGRAFDGLAHDGRAFAGLAHDGRAFEGLAHDARSAGVEANGRAFAGLAHEGRAFEGLAHDGRAFDGLAHDAGLAHDGRSFSGLPHDGLAHDGRAFAGLAHDGSAFAGLAHDGLAHDGRAFSGLAHDGLAQDGRAFAGLAHAGLAHEGRAFDGLAHDAASVGVDNNGRAFVGFAHDGISLPGPANEARSFNVITHDAASAGVEHSGRAFGGLAHDGRAFAAPAHDGRSIERSSLAGLLNGRSLGGSTHDGSAFVALAHGGGGFVGQSHDVRSFEQAQTFTRQDLVHSLPEPFPNGDALIHAAGHGLIDAGQVLADAAAAAGDALVHTINEANTAFHAGPTVLLEQPVKPVLLAEHPIVVADPKIVEEHVLIGNKIIAVPKKVEEDSDLIGPSGTISTRGGDTVISGPSSITIKGGGVVSEINKQPDIHVKSLEIKPVIPPVVIKPIATVEHTVISTPIITEARPVLTPQHAAIYAESAPILGVNPVVRTQLVDGLNPILTHKPAIIKSGPILATSFANHNAVFGNPLYAPEFLPFPVEQLAVKPFYGPLH